jgi:hypothetical protein
MDWKVIFAGGATVVVEAHSDVHAEQVAAEEIFRNPDDVVEVTLLEAKHDDD